MAARIAMIAITTSSSIKVNPPRASCLFPQRRTLSLSILNFIILSIIQVAADGLIAIGGHV
jgi:hypothetical protein